MSRWLLEMERFLDEIGRTTWDNDERIRLMASAAERPPLEPGGLRDSVDVLPQDFCGLGLVWW
jgi:hypothetical protein